LVNKMFGLRLRRRRLIDMLLPASEEQERSYNPAPTNPKLSELSEKFRRGIAKAIGIPPEYIREDRVRKWVEEWIKAWVKPEYWSTVLQSPSPLLVEALGFEIGNIIKESKKKK